MKAILDDLGMQAKINLRCDAKAARAPAQKQGLSERTRHVKVKHLYVQSLVRARSPRLESCDRNELGRHWDETFAESQTGIPKEFDGEELRERDDVPIRQYRTI